MVAGRRLPAVAGLVVRGHWRDKREAEAGEYRGRPQARKGGLRARESATDTEQINSVNPSKKVLHRAAKVQQPVCRKR